MDFALTEDLEAVADLADRVLREHGDPARLRRLELSGDALDRDCWSALADTGLLGVALPEEHGGAGMGWLAVHLLAEAAGRHAAHVPLADAATAATVLARGGDPTGVLPAAVAGHAVLALALQEVGASPDTPTTTAEPTGDGRVRLHGTKVVVPWATCADHLVVSAAPVEGGTPVVAVVAADAVTIDAHHLSGHVPHGRVVLDDALATPLADDAGLPWVLDRATAALASEQAGILDAAVRLAAAHTSEREQFGRPIATFQAVSQRVAAAFVDAECARLTALQAAWRLHEGLPATDEVAIAKWWAAEAGHRVLHAAQHVHGGIGVDRDYPLHRHLLRTKQLEFALGSAADQLGRLGAALAADPA